MQLQPMNVVVKNEPMSIPLIANANDGKERE